MATNVKTRREIIADAASLLNKLRRDRMADGEDLSESDEASFWRFMDLLPTADRQSVIN